MAQQGDGSALLELWGSVRGYCRRHAQRWSGRGADREDLTQATFLALYEAVRRFDPARGTFIAVFAFALRGAFRTAVYGGRSKRQQLDPIHAALSLDAPLGDDEDGGELADFIEDEKAAAAFEQVENKGVAEAVRNALEALTEAERRVLYLLYWDNLTQAEAAQELDMTEKSLKCIEASALRHLRHPTISKTLSSFL